MISSRKSKSLAKLANCSLLFHSRPQFAGGSKAPSNPANPRCQELKRPNGQALGRCRGLPAGPLPRRGACYLRQSAAHKGTEHGSNAGAELLDHGKLLPNRCLLTCELSTRSSTRYVDSGAVSHPPRARYSGCNGLRRSRRLNCSDGRRLPH